MRLLFLVFLTIQSSIAYSQLLLDTVSSPKELVLNQLLGSNSDLLIRQVKYTGKDFSIAGFSSKSHTGLIDEGILLSTGNVYHALGPNQSTRAGIRSNGAGDNDLQSIATGVVRDAAVLEFDFLALRDSIRFEYVFASEEYPEYVDKGVNDVFGFFIQEIGGRAVFPRNIAKLPDGRTTVSIDNVNHRKNERYFLRSDFLQAQSHAFWEANPYMMLRAQYYEFDGFTKILVASSRLQKGKWYHLKIAIADVGDRFFDSAVFLKAKSMKASGERIPTADSLVSQLIKEEIPELKDISITAAGELEFSMQINFETNEYAILSDSEAELNNLIQVLEKQPDIRLEIIGHTDNVGETAANQELSLQRAKSVRNYLIAGGVEESRLRFNGAGESKPIATNDSEQGRYKNRRVAFKLSY